MRRSTILILSTAQFIMVVDTTVMNVSISRVVSDLHTTVPAVQLAITLYALVMAAFMLTGAKLGDIWGRRRIFAIGLATYGTGSLITALSPNVAVLTVGWSLIEGAGAVLVIPAIAALTAGNYTGDQRALAYGLLGGVAGAAVAVGPLIGGFVTAALTWRLVFAAETVIVAGLLLVVRRIGDAPPQGRVGLDLPGAALSALGMGLFVLGVLKIPEWGLITPIGAPEIAGTKITPFGLSVVPFLMLGGIAVLIGFSRWERHATDAGRTPLLAPDLLGVLQLRAGASMLGAAQLIMAGTFFVLPLYLQIVLGKNALQTGIALLPISIAMMAAALTGPRLARSISPRAIVRIGLVVLFVSILGVMASIAPALTGAAFAVSLAGFGAGVGLIVSQLGNVVMSAVGQERASEAGGVQGTFQYLGASLGTALIGAVLLAGLTTGFHQRVLSDPAVPPALAQQLVAGTEQGLEMVSRQTAEAQVKKAGLPPQQTSAVLDAYEQAQLDALKQALLWAAAFALIALWFARRLPGEPLTQQRSGEPLPAGAVRRGGHAEASA